MALNRRTFDYATLTDYYWVSQPEDTIGGHCITVDEQGTEPRKPSDGAIQVGSFLGKDVSDYIVTLHNARLMRANVKTGPFPTIHH